MYQFYHKTGSMQYKKRDQHKLISLPNDAQNGAQVGV